MKNVTITITCLIDDDVTLKEINDIAVAAYVQVEDTEITNLAAFTLTTDPPFPERTHEGRLQRWLTEAKDAILADIEDGTFDHLKVESFRDLHERVDANMYVEKPFAAGNSMEQGIEWANEVVDLIDAWIQGDESPFKP